MRVIICGGQIGRAVIIGEIEGDRLPNPGENVRVLNARMLLRWDEKCGGLLGFAAHGPKADTRLTSTVPCVADTCRQAIAVTSEAASAIDAWPDYQ